MEISARLSALRKQLRQVPALRAGTGSRQTLFLSVSDGKARAHVVHASGLSFESVWQDVVAQLRGRPQRDRMTARWLRADWVEDVWETPVAQLKALLAATKRNYFRYGLAFDPEFRTAFLEQELNANAMLYGGNGIPHCILNQGNIAVYAKKRFGDHASLDLADQDSVYLLSTRGLFLDEDGRCHALDGPGLTAGRRQFDSLAAADVKRLVASGSAFLARQVKKNGSFIYGIHPCFDREVPAYNALRHASSAYAMLEAWTVTRDPALKQAIDRALSYLTGTLIRRVAAPGHDDFAFLVEQNGEIKLGGNAVCLLALAKYTEIFGGRDYLELMDRLAAGILHMQDATNGRFTHVLHYPDLRIKQQFRIIYYEGEAAFGLMRLHALTGNHRWLEAVERAFSHFIEAEHWKSHDHWLSYCVNELTRHRPEARYFEFGLKNVDTYLDFVMERITTFPTLLELMMAAAQMVRRLQDDTDHRHLLAALDQEKFYRALHMRALHLLNGHVWPEFAMFFANPARIVGSFFIRHQAFRVRIDDVEHYLSGLVAYLAYLETQDAGTGEAAAPVAACRAGWSAADVERATGGAWLAPPPRDWSATGLCIHAPTFREGQMVVLRRAGGTKGAGLASVAKLPAPPAAVIQSADDPTLPDLTMPVLKVADIDAAILAMGRDARTRFAGNVFGVTGSAGKTTCVAMLAHGLGPFGLVEHSGHNANLPHGVAWNLASFDQGAKNIVLELAVGRMGQSARLARPHIAIFTNIVPAHLGASSTVKDIARTKAGIFSGMAPGDVAVLNRDMLELETVLEIAHRHELRVLFYGASDDCHYSLLDYHLESGTVRARFAGRDVCYRLAAPGRHMAYNSLAVAAAITAAGYDFEQALPAFAAFKALPGRGEDVDVDLGSRHLHVIDDAYNANPGSMAAALDRLHLQETAGRKVAVLGQMAELGPHEADFHTQLASAINRCNIDQVYAIGPLYRDFWSCLQPHRRAGHVESLEQVKPLLLDGLCNGDTVLLKGSHSTKVHELVDWLKKGASAEPHANPETHRRVVS